MKYGCVMITGASSGLGAEFSRQLALESKQLVLIARRGDKLETLKEDLLAEYSHLQVELEVIDLNQAEQIERLLEKLVDDTYQPDVLINNAGMGDLGTLAKSEWSKLHGMLNLNVVVLSQMAHAVIPGMTERGGGEILNVSSLASILPIPDFSAYAASKAYVSSFSEALRLELKEVNIKVSALCPGPIHTEFGDVATRDPNVEEIPMKENVFVSKEQAVSEGIAAMMKNKARVFPGLKIKLAAVMINLLPMPIVRLIMARRPRKID